MTVTKLSSQDLYDLPPLGVSASFWQDASPTGEIQYLPSDGMARQELTLAHFLDRVQGITFQRRGIGSLEPNIRGFARDRLTTTFNGHYLPIAAPTFTAAPLNFISPTFAGKVEVLKGFCSVRLGPVPTGGRIDVDPFPEGSPPDNVIATIATNPGSTVFAISGNPLSGMQGADGMVSVYSVQAGSYDSGEKKFLVDEDYVANGFTGAFSVRTLRDSGFKLAINYQSQESANNPSLPLDSDGTEAIFLTTEWTQAMFSGQLGIRIGYADVSHTLSSDRRPIAITAPIEGINTSADADSSSFRVAYDCDLSGNMKLSTGIDYTCQHRNALRERNLKSGVVLQDHIWPAIRVRQSGVFTEVSGGGRQALAWRLGARIEETGMNIGGAEAVVNGIPGSKGKTIADNFAYFNGSDPSQLGRTFWTGCLQALVHRRLTETIDVIAATEYTVAPPGSGETYRAFLNALGGGVELGNPELKSEQKKSMAFEIRNHQKERSLSLQVWVAEIDDYVSRIRILEQPLVYSFRNVDAHFYGLEATASIQPFPDSELQPLSLKFAVSRTWGKEDFNGLGLPEVPPWKAVASILWNERFQKGPVSAHMYLRYTAGAINPQPTLNPIFFDSEAFTIVDVAAHYRVTSSLLVSVAVENLLDELAYAYLQPPVATGPVMPSGGNLQPGDRIPLPGISLSLAVRWQF